MAPAPERSKQGSTWRTFLRHYKVEMLACDFFTVETAWLKTMYVSFFIELESRHVHVAGCTDKPTAAWVMQQARQMSWITEDEQLSIRFLLRDRDAKFAPAFDTVFAVDDVTIIRTPFRSPKANAFAERWIRSVREKCLDHVLILHGRHLQRVLNEYTTYFNHARPIRASTSRSRLVTRVVAMAQLIVEMCSVASSMTITARPHSELWNPGRGFRTLQARSARSSA